MQLERPDLSGLDPEIVAYIEALEAQLTARPSRAQPAASEPLTPAEAPTTMQVITLSADRFIKRTARHEYTRQRRGGMGVFDMEVRDTDQPVRLAIADEADTLLVITSHGRVFRQPVVDLPVTPVRGRGQPLAFSLPWLPDERVSALLVAGGGFQAALVSERGWVRTVRASFMGSTMIDGTRVHDSAEGGALAAACWCAHTDQLFVVTQQGLAIRFLASQVPGRRGRLGLRTTPGDAVIDVTAVNDDSAVFLLGADGKGTVRLMAGFRANKAPGAGGKVAMKTDRLVAADVVSAGADLFLISATAKAIRFSADEVPAKTGVVQGVNCISLRADAATAMVVGDPAEV